MYRTDSDRATGPKRHTNTQVALNAVMIHTTEANKKEFVSTGYAQIRSNTLNYRVIQTRFSLKSGVAQFVFLYMRIHPLAEHMASRRRIESEYAHRLEEM